MLRKALVILLIFSFSALAFSSGSAQDNTKKGGMAGAPPRRDDEKKASPAEVMAFLEKVDAHRYRLEQQGVKDFSCTIPLGIAKPTLGREAKALLFWKAPDKVAVKFAGIKGKKIYTAKLMLENYFEELIRFTVGVPLRLTLAPFDMNVKKGGDRFTLTGRLEDPKKAIRKEFEIITDLDFTIKFESHSVTQGGRTSTITRTYVYKKKEGTLLPTKIRIKGVDNRITTVDIEYRKHDGIWIRNRSMNTPMAKEALNLKEEEWEYKNVRLNTGLDDSLFEKGK